MRDLTDLAVMFAVWLLFAIAALCIFLLIFFIGDAIINGVYSLPICEVTQ